MTIKAIETQQILLNSETLPRDIHQAIHSLLCDVRNGIEDGAPDFLPTGTSEEYIRVIDSSIEQAADQLANGGTVDLEYPIAYFDNNRLRELVGLGNSALVPPVKGQAMVKHNDFTPFNFDWLIIVDAENLNS